MKIKDSGERTEYSTGAVRDCKEGKGRFDLMPIDIMKDYVDEPFIKRLQMFQETGNTFAIKAAIKSLSNELNEVHFYKSKEEMLLEVAKHFEEGALKYGENNWQKGIPIHSYIDSAIRHYVKQRAGWDDEPHDRACIWNLICCAWTMKHHPEMDDYTEKKEKKTK